MASTYSALKIELIATGEQSGTWGATTNTNLGDAALGEAITGSADVSFSGADVTVTLTDTNTSQTARNLRLNLTGTSGGARNLILGSGCQIEKLYLINNGLSDTVTVKNTTGTGVAVPAGTSTFVYNNGTNVVATITTATDNAFTIVNSADTTKKALFSAASVTTATTATFTLPAATTTLAGLGTTQTFSGATNTFSGNVSMTSSAFTRTATTQAWLDGSMTTGAWTVGGTAQTGAITLGRSTGAQTLNLATGATATATTKTINIGTAGLSGSTTAINIGSSVAGAGTNLAVTGSQGIQSITSTTAGQPSYLLLNNTADSSNGYLYAPNKQLGLIQSDVSANSIVYFSTQNTERMRIDSSGNVGIGTSSPTNSKLDVEGRGRFLQDAAATTGAIILRQNSGDTIGGHIQWVNNANTTQTGFLLVDPTLAMIFGTSGTEAMRITSNGKLLVSTINNSSGARIQVGPTGDNGIGIESTSTSTIMSQLVFQNPNGVVGTVQTAGSSTFYNTSSDYRLKENIVPMTGALAKVALLKPCTYKWKVDGSDGQGFIAHELAEVVPQCVSSEKDAVDADGNPQYQGVDTSFLVATLTASIQELKAIIDAQSERIAVLENKSL
jgi:hypothetical protein